MVKFFKKRFWDFSLFLVTRDHCDSYDQLFPYFRYIESSRVNDTIIP